MEEYLGLGLGINFIPKPKCAIDIFHLLEIDIILAHFRYEGEGVNEGVYLARGSI
jgi:hypothetical protein